MRYVAAYLLAVLSGNKSPSADDIKEILTSVGIDAEDACLKKVIGELKGKEIDDLIAAGREKLSAVPSGGGVAVSAGGGGATDAGEAAAEEEEKKEESEEEEDDDMGFGLFD